MGEGILLMALIAIIALALKYLPFGREMEQPNVWPKPRNLTPRQREYEARWNEHMKQLARERETDGTAG